MNSRTFLFLLTCLAVSNSARANDLLDTFDDAQTSSALWEMRKPMPDSSVVVTNGILTLRNRGQLLTKDPLKNPVQISGRFRFTGNVRDVLRIVLRTTGESTSAQRAFDNGIAVSIAMQNDLGTESNIFAIERNLLNTQEVIVKTNHNFSSNQFYDFKITDDGTSIKFYFDDLLSPLLRFSDISAPGQKVGFYNREGTRGGSPISDGSQVEIDFIDIKSSNVDQQQTATDGSTGARRLPRYKIGQSFTAGGTGTLAQIDVGFLGPIDSDGTLEIYAGEGASGELLQTASAQIVASQAELSWIPFLMNVPIVGGQKYSFLFTGGASMSDPFSIPISANVPYPDGRLIFTDPSGTLFEDRFDLVFRTYLVPDSFVPLVITQPQSQAVLAGTTVKFSVGAIANAPLSYQWLFNGVPIAGATNAELTLSAVHLKDNGNYSAAIRDVVGTFFSQTANLVILVPASTVTSGRFSAFSGYRLTLDGEPGFTYRIETSDNLLDWSAFTNATLNGASVTISDTSAAGHGQRFYRAVNQ
ncbi:MAG: immunoglobulin domain-containing protein [Verrucomicrobiota bacterium]